jgi:hypothetical protein
MRVKVVLALIVAAVAGVAVADQYVLPDFALSWPGKDGNLWSSELFLANPGPVTVRVSIPRFLPGVFKTGVPCYPPLPAFHEVPPYTTVMLSSFTLSQELTCPDAALGGLAFDADGPVQITSRVVNVRAGASTATVLSGLGQEVPAFGPLDLTAAGVTYQLPALLWDPLRCDRPSLFDIYLYLVNPGTEPVDVTLQQARNGGPGDLVINGTSVPTPYTLAIEPQGWRQLKVELGGALPAVCLPPQVVDLFFSATGGVAAIAAVVDRASQDPRTVLPVRTTP